MHQSLKARCLATGKTWVWTYDDAGNITSRAEYTYTTGNLTGNPTTISYGYDVDNTGWGDLLTNFKGQRVYSDDIGNITEVVATGREFTWKHGRQLASSYYNSATWNYTYNADGMRVKRTSGNKAYTYIYNGDMLRYMEYDSNTTDTTTPAKLYFTFDASGLPISVNYMPEGSATSYLFYYVHNLQGDVEGLVHGETGNVSIWYSYDAWGNTVVSGNMDHPGANTLININPFRYRSYVYDSETELYYLQSRYYDPEMGRFINADAFAATGQGLLGNNMFAYCGNNAVNYCDFSGALASYACYGDNHIFSDKVMMAGGSGGSIAATSKSASARVIANEVAYINNTNESAVLDAENFAFYNGTLVIRHSSDFLTSWALGGVILLNSNGVDRNTLKHEYGHILQEDDLGIVGYIQAVFIPSVVYNVGSRFNKLMNDNYYNMPWEYDADIRGGAIRNHADWAEWAASLYWERWR